MESTTVTEERVHRTAPVDILLVGEQTMFREGVRKVFEGDARFNVVGDASDAEQALMAIADLMPDIVIVGLSGQPLARTMQTLRDLTAAGNCARTILLTTTVEDTDVMQARQLGVAGILLSDTSPQVLFDSVRSVAAGSYWFGREAVDDLADGLLQASAIHDSRFELTMRELEAVEAVVCRGTNWSIAGQLSISDEAVRHHLADVFNGPFSFNRHARSLFSSLSGPAN